MPSTHEIVYEYDGLFVISFSPDERGYEGVLAIRPSEDAVGRWFGRGKELPDPEKLLRGSGKQTRSIYMDSASMLARPGVVRLKAEAIERSRVPFAPTGRGPVIIRSTTAKRRRSDRSA